PQLIRSDEQAIGVAEALGVARAVVMRGNGAVTVGTTLVEAVVHAWFLEEAARVELDVLAAAQPEREALLTIEEAQRRAVVTGGIYERMWEYLTHGDPE